jgi:hypothetical protein
MVSICEDIGVMTSMEIGAQNGGLQSAVESDLCVVDADVLPKTIVYAGPVALGSGDGSSWSNMKQFGNPLLMDVANIDKEIWVKQGTYSGTLTLSNRMYLFGGFRGFETARYQRDSNPVTNGTVITGSGASPCFIVPALPTATISNAVLDGFTIRDGSSMMVASGGGITLAQSSGVNFTFFTVRNTRIINCINTTVIRGGGGILVRGDSTNNAAGSFLKMCNVTVSDNRASNFGGGICSDMPSFLWALNCIFTSNIANVDGGAIYLGSIDTGTSRYTFVNCLFVNNTSLSVGAAVLQVASSATYILLMVNSTFYGNSSTSTFGVIHIATTMGTYQIRNSIFWNNSAGPFDDVSAIVTAPLSVNTCIAASVQPTISQINVIASDPLFVNAPSDLRLSAESPAINFGNNSFLSGLGFTVPQDLDGNVRIVNEIVDLGPYEYGVFSRPVYSFCARFSNCSEKKIRNTQVKLNFEASLLNKPSCDFVIVPSSIVITSSNGVAVNTTGNSSSTPYNGGIPLDQESSTNIFLRPFTWPSGDFQVCVSFVITNTTDVSLLAPVWSLSGEQEGCIPIHISAIAGIDCIPIDVYVP